MKLELIQFNKQEIFEKVLYIRCYSNDGVFEIFNNHCNLFYKLNKFTILFEQYQTQLDLDLRSFIFIKDFIVKIIAF